MRFSALLTFISAGQVLRKMFQVVSECFHSWIRPQSAKYPSLQLLYLSMGTAQYLRTSLLTDSGLLGEADFQPATRSLVCALECTWTLLSRYPSSPELRFMFTSTTMMLAQFLRFLTQAARFFFPQGFWEEVFWNHVTGNQETQA